MCDFMICGTTTMKHLDHSLDQQIFCPFCLCMAHLERLTDRTYCTFFFIPIINCTESAQYTACSQCKCKLSTGQIRSCVDCHNVIFSGYDFCGRCGRRADLVPRQNSEHRAQHSDELQTHEMPNDQNKSPQNHQTQEKMDHPSEKTPEKMSQQTEMAHVNEAEKDYTSRRMSPISERHSPLQNSQESNEGQNMKKEN